MMFHGTKISPEQVAREGLLPIDILGTVEEIRRQFALGPAFSEDEEVQDHVRRKRACHFVYLTDDFTEARSYGLRGSNFRGLLESEARRLLGRPVYRKLGGFVYVVDIRGSGEIKAPRIPQSLILGYVIVTPREGEQIDG